MASDTATGSMTVATDQCVGFAEPAEILTRLAPDDLHPSRLAGPHAWHPWGLTVAPPTDRHLRLILPPTDRAGAAEQLLDRLEGKLARTPWPPDGPLEIRRERAQFDCRDGDARRALIEVTIADATEGRGTTDVVTRDGWPILHELAALNDRIRCIDPDEPSRNDLADLVVWVENKMAAPDRAHPLTASLPQLLRDQARDHPAATDRLRSILSRQQVAAGQHARVLNYLAEQLPERLVQGHRRSR
jgi:hypothetical protein